MNHILKPLHTFLPDKKRVKNQVNKSKFKLFDTLFVF